MSIVTLDELIKDPMKVLKRSYLEDVQITNNGIVVGLLTSPYIKQINELKSVFGILPEGTTVEEGKEERYKHYLES